MTTNIEDILKLPADERLEIVEKIWESLDENVPYDDEEINIAKERYEDYKKTEGTLDWDDVKKELFQKYGLGN
ncbi:MAG: addiction module protein [Segetibacter sp.]